MKTLPISLGLTVLTGSLVLLSAAGPARSVVLIGNIPQTNDGRFSNINSISVKALAFTLPAGDNYRLDNAIVRLNGYTTGELPVLQIRNDTGGSDPGNTVLASFTAPASQGTGIFNYTFTPTSSFTFLAGTKYWLYLTAATNGGAFGWAASFPGLSPTGIPDIALTGNRFTGNINSLPFSDDSFINTFQINATVITPEPGTIVALSLFGLGLLGVKGRRG